MKKVACLITLFSTLFLLNVSYASRPSLTNSGRIIAHENGWMDFNPLTECQGLNTCPAQITAIEEYNKTVGKQKKIYFLKMSLRTLSDGSWVISHNKTQPFYVQSNASYLKSIRRMLGIMCGPSKHGILPTKYGYTVCTATISELSSTNLFIMKYNYGVNIDLYRLRDFVNADTAHQLYYMLYLKVDPNHQLIDDIYNIGVSDRTILESRNNNDAQWFHDNQGARNIYYTGRIGLTGNLTNDKNAVDQLAATAENNDYINMWAIEISGVDSSNKEEAQNVANYVNSQNPLGYQWQSEIDSMHYLPTDEAVRTPCREIVNNIDASMTMTSKPIECLEHVNNFPNQNTLHNNQR